MTNAAGASSPAMAEFALCAMIMLARGMPQWLEAQAAREWRRPKVATGCILHGKRLALIGYGSVARHLAPACRALGMHVTAVRRTPGYVSGEVLDARRSPSALREVLGESDFIVLAASLNSTSQQLLGRSELECLRPTAFLVNIARGGLVDQDNLIERLQNGEIAGAALDATSPEPLPRDSPLWSTANVILTPHVSGDTPEGWDRTMDLFVDNLALYCDGHLDHMANLVSMASHR